jgi:hypothetical protein
MFLKHMRPDQVHDTIARKMPLLLPAGCVECHGSHAALGLDTIAAEDLCLAIAERVPAVVAPSIEYGPTGWAVSGPELGTVDVDGNHFYLYVKDVLRLAARLIARLAREAGIGSGIPLAPLRERSASAGFAILTLVHREMGSFRNSQAIWLKVVMIWPEAVSAKY